MITNCNVNVKTLKVTDGNFEKIRDAYNKLRKQGWEPLVQLTGEHPTYYASLYKPSRKSLTLF